MEETSIKGAKNTYWRIFLTLKPLYIFTAWAIVFVLGCATVPIVDESMLEKGSTALLWKEAARLGEAGFYKQERIVLDEIISRDSNNQKALFLIEKSLFQEAKKDSQREKYQKVKKAFDNFFYSFPFEYALWTHPNTEEAIWILAVSFYKQINAPDRSQKETKEFIDTLENGLFLYFPDTRHRKVAEKMLYRARLNLARHSFFIGDFYLRTWALTSAELRFKSILEEYPGFLDKQVHVRLEEVNRKKNPTDLEKVKRFLFFERDPDTAKEAQVERERFKEQEEQESNKKNFQLQLP